MKKRSILNGRGKSGFLLWWVLCKVTFTTSWHFRFVKENSLNPDKYFVRYANIHNKKDIFIIRNYYGWVWWCMHLIPAYTRQRLADLCKLESSLVYKGKCSQLGLHSERSRFLEHSWVPVSSPIKDLLQNIYSTGLSYSQWDNLNHRHALQMFKGPKIQGVVKRLKTSFEKCNLKLWWYFTPQITCLLYLC